MSVEFIPGCPWYTWIKSVWLTCFASWLTLSTRAFVNLILLKSSCSASLSAPITRFSINSLFHFLIWSDFKLQYGLGTVRTSFALLLPFLGLLMGLRVGLLEGLPVMAKIAIQFMYLSFILFLLSRAVSSSCFSWSHDHNVLHCHTYSTLYSNRVII